jgi:Fe-S-cluster-containing hydrogenase component 2
MIMETLVMGNSILTEEGELSSEVLRRLCLEEGADDAGFVEIDRSAIAGQRKDILKVFPKSKTLMSLVQVMNRENIQSSARYVANDEFHHTIHDLTDTARRILKRLNGFGVRGVVPTVGFPMDMDRWGTLQIWDVSHKPIAEQAGMGRMGIHRNVIHPKFGNFILLETILIDTEVDVTGKPLDYNPCLTCNLCVAACPVGAVSEQREFDFSACLTHNYREFMGGFQEWTEDVVASKNVADYRSRLRDSETVSMWQSLAFGPNYKAAYCMAVCPAGEDVLPLYRQDEKGYVDQIVRPLKEKIEPVYVRKGTPAEKAALRQGNKEIRHVRNPARPLSIQGFIRGLKLVFNPLKAEGESATFEFQFTGKEPANVTVVVKEGEVDTREELCPTADLRVVADSEAWLRIVNKEVLPFWYLLTGKLKVRGNPLLLLKFQKWMEV